MNKKKFHGTGVAIVTPFKSDKTIDFDALEKLVERLINNNIDYLVVLGTTGETATLTKDEKNEVLDFVIKINNKRLPIIAGFGGNNTADLVENIKSRDFTDIDAILSVAPYYNKPSQEGIYQHYKTIAENSPVPIVLYNVPGRTSVNIAAETTLKLANDFNNIIAIKEASGDFTQIMEIIKNKPDDFTVISGDDALTLPLISIGVKGVISVTANAFPKEMSEMVNFALNDDFASAQNSHYQLIDVINTFFEDGNPGGVKAALSILGIIKNFTRLPVVPVNDKVFDKLVEMFN